MRFIFNGNGNSSKSSGHQHDQSRTATVAGAATATATADHNLPHHDDHPQTRTIGRIMTPSTATASTSTETTTTENEKKRTNQWQQGFFSSTNEGHRLDPSIQMPHPVMRHGFGGMSLFLDTTPTAAVVAHHTTIEMIHHLSPSSRSSSSSNSSTETSRLVTPDKNNVTREETRTDSSESIIIVNNTKEGYDNDGFNSQYSNRLGLNESPSTEQGGSPATHTIPWNGKGCDHSIKEAKLKEKKRTINIPSPQTQTNKKEEHNSSNSKPLSLWSAMKLWMRVTNHLLHSNVFLAFAHGSIQLLQAAASTAIHTALLPITLPLQFTQHSITQQQQWLWMGDTNSRGFWWNWFSWIRQLFRRMNTKPLSVPNNEAISDLPPPPPQPPQLDKNLPQTKQSDHGTTTTDTITTLISTTIQSNIRGGGLNILNMLRPSTTTLLKISTCRSGKSHSSTKDDDGDDCYESDMWFLEHRLSLDNNNYNKEWISSRYMIQSDDDTQLHPPSKPIIYSMANAATTTTSTKSPEGPAAEDANNNNKNNSTCLLSVFDLALQHKGRTVYFVDLQQEEAIQQNSTTTANKNDDDEPPEPKEKEESHSQMPLVISLALDKLVDMGLNLLANHPTVRLSRQNHQIMHASYQSHTNTIDWRPEGNTLTLLNKMEPMTSLDRLHALENGVLVWSGTTTKSAEMGNTTCTYPFFLARGVVQKSPESMMRLLWDNTRTAEYNHFCLGRTSVLVLHDQVLDTLDDHDRSLTGTKVVQSETRVPFTSLRVWVRCLMHVRPLEGIADEGGFVIVSRSLSTGPAGCHYSPDNNVEPMSKNEIQWGINVIRRVPNHPHLADLTSLSQVGSALIPKFLATRIGLLGIEEFFHNIRKHSKTILDSNDL